MTSANPTSKTSRLDLGPAWLVAASWLALYTWRTLAGHASLATNGFDLSVFDYALWDLTHGGRGHVPFMGESIFSQHFMPVLALLVPFYAPFQSPVALLLLQLAVVAGTSLLFARFLSRIGVRPALALALVATLLLARRTHGATAGSFYPECLQALFTFLVVEAWPRGDRWYWPVAVLFLMTKEDAAVYLAAGALTAHFTPWRNDRRTVWSVALAAVWLIAALAMAIPASRRADGLSGANPLIESRFGSPSGHVTPSALAGRLLTLETAERVAKLFATTGGLSVLGGAWMLPAVPGLLINLAADPDAMQSAVTGHYAWPVLPWLFMSAGAGVRWLSIRAPRAATVWVLATLAITMADSPALQRAVTTRVPPEANAVRQQLAGLSGEVILAQPNLIPHLPHQRNLFAVEGSSARPPTAPDLVLFTDVGDPWPLTPEAIRAAVEHYANDRDYVQVAHGPLHAFVRRPPPVDRD